MTSAPLNDRQFRVLSWIGNGCPDGVWSDHTYKASALALQNRHLAVVSKRGGVWRAELTDDGRFYLKDGEYPPSRRKPTARARTNTKSGPPRAAARQVPGDAGSAGAAAQNSKAAPSKSRPADPSAPQLLLNRVLAAHGRLVIQTQPFTCPMSQQVDEVNRLGLLSVGKVLRYRRRGWHHALVYVADDPQVAVAKREVPVPQRAARLHPAVAAFKQDRDFHAVSQSSLSRATRILQAIAKAVTEAGMIVQAPQRVGHPRHGVRDQLKVISGEFSVWLKIAEKSAPGGGPMPYHYPNERKRPPLWQARRHKTFIPTGRLILQIDSSYAQDGRQCKFQDTKRTPLEEHTQAIVHEIEMRLFRHREDLLEQEREQLETEQRWDSAVEKAKTNAGEDLHARALKRQADLFAEARRVNQYADAMEDHIATLDDPKQMAEANDWLTWIRTHSTQLNPLSSGNFLPGDPQFTRIDLEPYLQGWSEEYLARLDHKPH
jgi:hypothetical protein